MKTRESSAIQTLLRALKTEEIRGKLWIVQPGRIREYEPPDYAED